MMTCRVAAQLKTRHKPQHRQAGLVAPLLKLKPWPEVCWPSLTTECVDRMGSFNEYAELVAE